MSIMYGSDPKVNAVVDEKKRRSPWKALIISSTKTELCRFSAKVDQLETSSSVQKYCSDAQQFFENRVKRALCQHNRRGRLGGSRCEEESTQGSLCGNEQHGGV